MPPALRIDGSRFIDNLGREVILRGINVSADAKLPARPPIPSREERDFFDGDAVSFVGRPFALDSAHEHFARLRSWGYDVIRYVFTWEAVEHKGPGIYDEEFCKHTVDTLRIAGEYGFKAFLDPHQDVWSRFSGGSGAPMWTLYACGLDPTTFIDNEAAIVHNTWPDKPGIPKMIWTTNYFRLACQTMFTLFFAGRDFAPKAIINGTNIQDYLQDHFVGACQHLMRRINDAGGLIGNVVIGCESMNEPNKALLGWQDLTIMPREQRLRRGTCPTPWQAILLGDGREQTIDVWEIKWNGPQKIGTATVNQKKSSAWLKSHIYDTRYGFKRDAGWQLGQCIWSQHGVWNPSTGDLVKKDYFLKDPKNGETITYEYFANTWFKTLYRKYRDSMREVWPECIIICEGPVLEIPPTLNGTPDEDANVASALHWYDGMTLLFKKWNSWYTMDIIGMMRNKYSQEWMAIKFGGIGAIKKCFRDQFIFMKQEAVERSGGRPVLFTETGMPFDLNEKEAYNTGNFADQIASLDAVHFALEKSGIQGYTLWTYTANSNHEWGDDWNNEDFSIYSADDLDLPLRSQISSPSDPVKSVDKQQLIRTDTMETASTARAETPKKGHRAGEAHIRPWPMAVRGAVESFGFEMDTVTFNLQITAAELSPLEDEPAATIIYLPDYHFPLDETVINASKGSYNMSVDKGMRILKWWHPGGKQNISIVGVKKTDSPKTFVDVALDGVSWCLDTR